MRERESPPAVGESGAVFDAAASLASVLAWPALPAVLRRSLTRSLTRETVETLSLLESVRGWRQPALREWIVALLALDVGVSFAKAGDTHKSMIGLFSEGNLDTVVFAQCFVPKVLPGQGFGSAFRPRGIDGAGGVSAAAFVYRDAASNLEADFVFLAGATKAPVVQLKLAWVEGRPLNEQHLEDALTLVARQVAPGFEDVSREVVREALIEALEGS